MDFPEFHRAVKRHLKAAGKLHGGARKGDKAQRAKMEAMMEARQPGYKADTERMANEWNEEWEAGHDDRMRARAAALDDETDRRNGLAVGTTRGLRNFNSGLTQVADYAVSTPGFSETMGSVYKHFAPPGSKYYQPGTLGDKAVGYAADTAVDAVKGLVGGARKGRRLRARGGADAPPPQPPNQPYWMNPAFIAAQQAAQQQQAAQAAAAIAAFLNRRPVAGDLVPEADWVAARAVTPRRRDRAAGG